jgi:hypothetical protein
VPALEEQIVALRRDQRNSMASWVRLASVYEFSREPGLYQRTNLRDDLVEGRKEFVRSERGLAHTFLAVPHEGQPPVTVLNLAALENGRRQIFEPGEESVIAMKRNRTEDHVEVMLDEERRPFVKRPPDPALAAALLKQSSHVRAAVL